MYLLVPALSNVRIGCFSLSYVSVSEMSVGFGLLDEQNKLFEDARLGFQHVVMSIFHYIWAHNNRKLQPHQF